MYKRTYVYVMESVCCVLYLVYVTECLGRYVRTYVNMQLRMLRTLAHTHTQSEKLLLCNVCVFVAGLMITGYGLRWGAIKWVISQR